jgi:hypothetical protein
MLVGRVFDLFPTFFHVLAQPGHRVAPGQAGEAGNHQESYQFSGHDFLLIKFYYVARTFMRSRSSASEHEGDHGENQSDHE